MLQAHQNNKEKLQKELVKDIKVFLQRKMKNSDNMVVKDTKIYQKIKKKLAEYRKKYYEIRKNALL